MTIAISFRYVSNVYLSEYMYDITLPRGFFLAPGTGLLCGVARAVLLRWMLPGLLRVLQLVLVTFKSRVRRVPMRYLEHCK